MESTLDQKGRLLQQSGQTNDRIHHDETSKVCLKRTSDKRKLSEGDIKTQEHKRLAALERNVLDPCTEKARWMDKKNESDDYSELSVQNMKAMNTKPLIFPSRLKHFDYQQKFIIRSSVIGESNIHGLQCRSRKDRTVKQKSRHTNACGTSRKCHTKRFTKHLPNTKSEDSIQKLCTEVELLNLNVRRQSCNSYFEKSFIKGYTFGEKLCLKADDRLSPLVADVTAEENVVPNIDSNKQDTHTEVDNVLSNLTPAISDDAALEKSALSHHQDSLNLTPQELACITAVSRQTGNNHDGAIILADVRDCSRATSNQSLISDAQTYVAEEYNKRGVTSESVSFSAENPLHFILHYKDRVVYSPTRNDLSAKFKGISMMNCGSANLKDSELNGKLHILYEPEHVKQQPVGEKRKHPGGNLWNSETSGNHLRSAGSLHQHMTKHSSADQYKCENCGKCFSCKQQVVEHMTIHTGERPYKCDACGKCFKQKSTCRVHESGHVVEKRHKCEICGKCFRRKCDLNVHMKIHTGEKPYKCEICGRCFTNKSNLKCHMSVHTGEKPYKCETCGMKFRKMWDLTKHMRTHTGEKPYNCETCGMSFKVSHALKSHMRIHTGEKPYKCETCGRCFALKGNLTCHMRIHTGEKPYYCEICRQSFSSKSHLIHHLQRQHTEKKRNE